MNRTKVEGSPWLGLGIWDHQLVVQILIVSLEIEPCPFNIMFSIAPNRLILTIFLKKLSILLMFVNIYIFTSVNLRNIIKQSHKK